MTSRSLLPLLALVALLLAPFGRMAAAEAMVMPPAAAHAAAGHCDEGAAPDSGDPANRAVDCLTACTVMTAPAAAAATPARNPAAAFAHAAPDGPAGIRPEAEPPPPRS